MGGWNMPDDVNECRGCGVPVGWPMTECDWCASGRDPKTGRFVSRAAVLARDVLDAVPGLADADLADRRSHLAALAEVAGAAVRPVVETTVAALDDELRRRGIAVPA